MLLIAHTTETEPFFRSRGNETGRSHQGSKLKWTATITKPDVYEDLSASSFCFVYKETSILITSNFNLPWKM